MKHTTILAAVLILCIQSIGVSDAVDVVLLDLTMPKVPGRTVLEKMLEIRPDVKVVISTGQSEEESHEGVLSRAKGFLKKPYEVWDMTESIRCALEG